MTYAEYKKKEIQKYEEDPKKGTKPQDFEKSRLTIGKGAKSRAPKGHNRTW